MTNKQALWLAAEIWEHCAEELEAHGQDVFAECPSVNLDPTPAREVYGPLVEQWRERAAAIREGKLRKKQPNPG